MSNQIGLKEEGKAVRILHVYLIVCLLNTGCAALLTKQEYIPINEKAKRKQIFYGLEFSISEKKDIRKIAILGTGTIQNIEIYARVARNDWKQVKKIKRAITLPAEIYAVVHADAIRILQRSTTGRGRIDTVKFYTITHLK